MLTEAQYKALRDAVDLYDSEARRLYAGGKDVAYSIPADASDLPPHVSNEERSQIEIYEFVTNPPAKYFAYVGDSLRDIHTWMGDTLGRIVSTGIPYRGNMGDKRINIRVKAINGLTYAGTFYQSAGDYCRLKVVKA